MNIFLDLDGTLTDPADGITRCIQYALSRLERPVPGRDQLLGCIGPPLHASFAELLDGDQVLAHRAVALYRERFGEIGLFENAPYPGIAEALEGLRKRGTRLFVATSKPTVYACRIVSHFGLDRHLEEVFGSEMDRRLAVKADLLAHVLDTTGSKPAETLMVGDRRHDIEGARANHIHPVGVDWGYGSREELIAAGAVEILSLPQQLEELRLPGGIKAQS